MTLTVNKASISITFDDLTKTYGDPNFEFTATSSSTGAFSFTISNTSIATMVDSVKNLVSRIDPQNKSVVQKASVETEAKTSASGRVTSPGQEASVKVSDLSKLSKEPPVDFEAVERIKTAISKGQYPIDLDRVSDALLDAYVELKS